MKQCPTCNRTFDDTMSFCLVDGTILSAPFDPHVTHQNAAARQTDPAPTEASKGTIARRALLHLTLQKMDG